MCLFVAKFGLLPALRSTLLRGDVHFSRGFVDRVGIDHFFNRTMVAALSLPKLLLVRELLGQGLVNLASTFVIRVAPQTTVAVTIVAPARVINDRIKTQTFEL